jgi:AraC-like DNA-binding protein
MAFNDVLGVRVLHCRMRQNYRTPFVRKNPDSKANTFTLTYLVRGRARVRLDKASFIAGPGDVVLWHTAAVLEFTALEHCPLSFYVMTFEPSPAPSGPRHRALGLPPLCRIKAPAEITRLFQDMITLFRGRRNCREQECSLLAMRILLSLKPQPLPPAASLHEDGELSADKRMQDALNFMNANYKKRLNLRMLAEKACMHPRHFGRLFKQKTGLTPHRYMLELKIEKAKDYVLLWNQSPTNAAQDLGFYDYSHFYQAFKRFTGKSPKEFLNNAQA